MWASFNNSLGWSDDVTPQFVISIVIIITVLIVGFNTHFDAASYYQHSKKVRHPQHQQPFGC